MGDLVGMGVAQLMPEKRRGTPATAWGRRCGSSTWRGLSRIVWTTGRAGWVAGPPEGPKENPASTWFGVASVRLRQPRLEGSHARPPSHLRGSSPRRLTSPHYRTRRDVVCGSDPPSPERRHRSAQTERRDLYQGQERLAPAWRFRARPDPDWGDGASG